MVTHARPTYRRTVFFQAESSMNHKLLSSLFASTLALGLTACGGGDDTTSTATAGTPAPSAPAPAPTPSPAPAPSSGGSSSSGSTSSPAPAPAPTPAPAPAASAGAASECFNIAWYTPGTTAVLDYAITGSATGSTRSNMTVSGGKTFNGQSGLLEFFQDQTTTYTAPATLASAGTIPTQSRFYFSENGSVENEYGGTVSTSMTVSGISISTNTTVNYNPAVVDRRFTLAVGGTTTLSTTLSTTSTTNFGSTPTTSTSRNDTVTYVGQETLTIPAGTFTACKFSIRDKDGNVTLEWFGKGNGAPLQFTSRASDGSSFVGSLTTASRLNGAAL
jgi:hypothetical protein